MSTTLKIRFSYSVDNLQRANMLHYRKNYPFRGRVLIWFGVLLIWTGLLLAALKGFSGNELMIYTFLIYGLIVIVIHFYIMKTLGKRLFKKHSHRVLPIDIEINDESISFAAGENHALVKWNEFEKATIGSDVILLYLSKLTFYIFPKENFSNGEFDYFLKLVRKNVKELK